jgi:hypothetical protein
MKLKYYAIAVLLLSAATASAQMPRVTGERKARNDNDQVNGAIIKRLTIGYGMHFAPNTLDVSYRENELLRRQTVNIRAEDAKVIFLSTFAPLGRISEKSALALDFGVSATLFTFRHDTLITPGGAEVQQEIPITMINVPISFDFKTGGEVSLNKEHRTVFAAGIGVAPAMIQNDIAMRIGATPFLKVEAGFLAGMVFKVRGMLYLGQGKYVNDKEIASGPWLTRRSSGPLGGSIGIAIVPFAFGWEKPF